VDVRNDLRLFDQPLTARATAVENQVARLALALDHIGDANRPNELSLITEGFAFRYKLLDNGRRRARAATKVAHDREVGVGVTPFSKRAAWRNGWVQSESNCVVFALVVRTN
jgi:hypothetical protein